MKLTCEQMPLYQGQRLLELALDVLLGMVWRIVYGNIAFGTSVVLQSYLDWSYMEYLGRQLYISRNLIQSRYYLALDQKYQALSDQTVGPCESLEDLCFGHICLGHGEFNRISNIVQSFPHHLISFMYVRITPKQPQKINRKDNAGPDHELITCIYNLQICKAAKRLQQEDIRLGSQRINRCTTLCSIANIPSVRPEPITHSVRKSFNPSTRLENELDDKVQVY